MATLQASFKAMDTSKGTTTEDTPKLTFKTPDARLDGSTIGGTDGTIKGAIQGAWKDIVNAPSDFTSSVARGVHAVSTGFDAVSKQVTDTLGLLHSSASSEVAGKLATGFIDTSAAITDTLVPTAVEVSELAPVAEGVEGATAAEGAAEAAATTEAAATAATTAESADLVTLAAAAI